MFILVKTALFFGVLGCWKLEFCDLNNSTHDAMKLIASFAAHSNDIILWKITVTINCAYLILILGLVCTKASLFSRTAIQGVDIIYAWISTTFLQWCQTLLISQNLFSLLVLRYVDLMSHRNFVSFTIFSISKCCRLAILSSTKCTNKFVVPCTIGTLVLVLNPMLLDLKQT